MGGIVQPEQEQMERYAEAFYSLAELFQKLPGQKERLNDEDLRILFEDVRERVCAACGNGKQCWNESYYDKCRMLYELLKEMERSGTFSMIQKKQLSDICERPQQLALALRTGYEEARTNLLWSNRMMEQRRAAGEQIYQTAELLKHTAEGFTGMPEQEQRIARRLRRELFFLNTEMDAIRVFLRETGRMEIYLTLHAGKRTVVSVKSIAEALSDCCGINMRPAFDCRTAVTLTPAIFHFVPDTRYQFLCGIARITKAGEMVSGDNYTLLQKDSGKVVMSLADGMGSGTAANQESEKVIELLERFLCAGFPQETAVRIMNSCLLLQNSSQVFSTIDLCMVDLYNAKCDMIKSGAAASFIRRDGEIEVIRSNTFPSGVIQQSDYESMHRTLESGTSIVMMTDGVLDSLPGENREQTMAELIVRTMTQNAQEYARRLMERVYLMQNLEARDDMTILIGTLWEKA